MMKKNAIALGIAALIGGLGFVSGASAGVIKPTGNANAATDLQTNFGGIGHSLLFPYYTVQNGNSTLINIVNTDTANGKAVKVRFRGASNSDDVFDFQLFLSPGDVWTANVSQGTDGRASLTTNDKSCTLPTSVNQSFVLDRLPTQINADERANQSREGYVEVFTMADIPRTGTANDDTITGVNRLYTAIKHVNNVPPCTSSALNRLTSSPGDIGAASALGMSYPTTGLFGNYSIVNMNTAATSWTGEATSLLATRATSPTNNAPIPGIGNLVFFPQTAVSVGNVDAFTADPLFRQLPDDQAPKTPVVSTPAVAAQFFDLPDMSTPYLVNETGPRAQAFQLSQAIARTSIKNEILTDPVIDARTDWLFSMPTRRYSVAADYRTYPFVRLFSDLGGVGGNFFTAANTSIDNGGQICVNAEPPTVYNREEDSEQGGFVISPGTAASVRFCGEVSVLSFNAGTVNPAATGASRSVSVLSARITRQNLDTSRRDGWANLPTTNGGMGLPILGRAFVQATNPSVSAIGGRSANFGGSWEHRFTKPGQ